MLGVPSATALEGYETFTLAGPSPPTTPPIATNTGALTFDGTTVILVNAAQNGFLQAPLEGFGLGKITTGPFGTLNQTLMSGTPGVGRVVISADGLTLYFALQNPAGIFSATRPSTNVDFSAATLVAGVQQFWGVTGVSSDDLTLFLIGPAWEEYVLSRAHKTDPWNADALMGDGGLLPGIVNYFNAMPTADCHFLMTNCNPGGGWITSRVCMLPRL
jgi:hypothetical protein